MQPLDPSDPVLSEHENAQVHERLQVGDDVESVVIEVEENESVSVFKMLDALDQVVLEAQKT